MADDTVERLAVLIEANTKQYSAAMTKLEKDTQRAIFNSTKAVTGLNTSLASIGAAAREAAGMLGVAFGASALVSQVRASVRELGDLSDAAERAGVSAEKLQVLRFAMEQTTGSAEQADAALSKFNVTLGQAATTGKGADIFKALGVNIRDVNGAVRESSAVFDDVIKQFAQIKSPAQLAAVSVMLFGKSAGPDMAALLQDGGKSLDEFHQKMTDLGLLMSNDMVKAGDELDNKFKLWAGTVDVIWKKAIISASESIAGTVTTMNTLSTRLDEFVANPSFKTYLQFLAGDYAGAIANFVGAPIVETNIAGKGNRLPGKKALTTLNPGATNNQSTVNLGLLDKEKQKADQDAQNRLDAFNKQIEAVKKRTNALVAETATMRDSVYEQERSLTVSNLLSEAEERHIKVTDDVRQAIDRTAEAYGHAAEMADKAKQFYSALDDLAGQTFDALDSVVSKSKSASDAIKSLLADLLRAQAKAMFLQAFNPAGGQGPISALLSGLPGFGGARASGGPVDTGRAYMVGEQGPELFVPRTPGRIEANRRAGGAVTIINNIDASGADMAAIKRLEGALIQSNKSIEQRSLAAIARYQTERA
jgi:hypothetical protein